MIPVSSQQWLDGVKMWGIYVLLVFLAVGIVLAYVIGSATPIVIAGVLVSCYPVVVNQLGKRLAREQSRLSATVPDSGPEGTSVP